MWEIKTRLKMAIPNKASKERLNVSLQEDVRDAFSTRSFALDQAHLLVLGLAPPRPVRRHVDAILFLLITLLLGLMHGCRLVLRRTVDSIQDQRGRACVDKLMLSSGWDNDQIAGFHILILACDGGFAGA
jgi:hypothetical protein